MSCHRARKVGCARRNRGKKTSKPEKIGLVDNQLSLPCVNVAFSASCFMTRVITKTASVNLSPSHLQQYTDFDKRLVFFFPNVTTTFSAISNLISFGDKFRDECFILRRLSGYKYFAAREEQKSFKRRKTIFSRIFSLTAQSAKLTMTAQLFKFCPLKELSQNLWWFHALTKAFGALRNNDNVRASEIRSWSVPEPWYYWYVGLNPFLFFALRDFPCIPITHAMSDS